MLVASPRHARLGMGHQATEREAVRLENRPAYTSWYFLTWCEEQQIQRGYILPGDLMQNRYVESTSRCFRDERLNANSFLTLGDAAEVHSMSRSFAAPMMPQDRRSGS